MDANEESIEYVFGYFKTVRLELMKSLTLIRENYQLLQCEFKNGDVSDSALTKNIDRTCAECERILMVVQNYSNHLSKNRALLSDDTMMSRGGNKEIFEKAMRYFGSITRYDLLDGIAVISAYMQLCMHKYKKSEPIVDYFKTVANKLMDPLSLMVYSINEYYTIANYLKSPSKSIIDFNEIPDQFRRDAAKKTDSTFLFLKIVERISDRKEFAEKLQDLAKNGAVESTRKKAAGLLTNQVNWVF